MTQCFPSPPLFNRFGNKRNSDNAHYGEDLIDLSQSMNPFKRQKNQDFEQSHSDKEVNTFTHSGHIEQQPQQNRIGKRSRESSNEQNQNLQNNIGNAGVSLFPTFPSNQIDMRIELQKSIDKKDAEIISLCGTVQHMESQMVQHQTVRCACEEENKILKRAVTIQDHRQKELAGQNHQLQAVLSQAAEHISNLERINRELRIQLDSGSYPTNNDFTYRPPDVF